MASPWWNLYSISQPHAGLVSVCSCTTHAHALLLRRVPRTNPPRTRTPASPPPQSRPCSLARCSAPCTAPLLPQWFTLVALMLLGETASQTEPWSACLAISSEPAAAEPHPGDPRRRCLSPPLFGPPDPNPTVRIQSARSQRTQKMVNAGCFAESPLLFTRINP